MAYSITVQTNAVGTSRDESITHRMGISDAFQSPLPVLTKYSCFACGRISFQAAQSNHFFLPFSLSHILFHMMQPFASRMGLYRLRLSDEPWLGPTNRFTTDYTYSALLMKKLPTESDDISVTVDVYSFLHNLSL